MLHESVGSIASGGTVPVHEYPVEGLLHPLTVESAEQPVVITMVAPAEQQYRPVPSPMQLPAAASGTALPVQLYPVPALHEMVESVLHVSTVTLAEQPAPPSKSEKSPRTTNQEIRMRVRLSVLRLEEIYSDGPPILGDESAGAGERLFTLTVSTRRPDPTIPPP